MGSTVDFWNTFKEEAKKKAANVQNILAEATEEAKIALPLLKNKKVDCSLDEITWNPNSQEDTTKDILAWLGKMLKKLKVVENSLAIKTIFGLIKKTSDDVDRNITDIQVEVNDIKKKNIELQQEMVKKEETCKEAIDEARQRGMKGNLIVSSPYLPGKNGRDAKLPIKKEATQEDPTRMESDQMLCIKMIYQKTGIRVHQGDIGACHKIPVRGERRGGVEERMEASNTFVITFWNRKAGSSWDLLTQCMRAGKCRNKEEGSMNKEINVFINYQLTPKRAMLAKAARLARYDGKVQRDSVDANGIVSVRIGEVWKPVKSEKELDEVTRHIVARPNNRQQQAGPLNRQQPRHQ